MTRTRIVLAVLALLTLGAMAVHLAPAPGEGPPGDERLGIAFLLLLLPLAWPAPLWADPAAEQILAAAGVRGGLIVHAGCGGGQLTAPLRASDRYVVRGLDADAVNVARARPEGGRRGGDRGGRDRHYGGGNRW